MEKALDPYRSLPASNSYSLETLKIIILTSLHFNRDVSVQNRFHSILHSKLIYKSLCCDAMA